MLTFREYDLIQLTLSFPAFVGLPKAARAGLLKESILYTGTLQIYKNISCCIHLLCVCPLKSDSGDSPFTMVIIVPHHSQSKAK